MSIKEWFTSYFGKKFPEIQHKDFIKIVVSNFFDITKVEFNDNYYRMYSKDTVERKLQSLTLDRPYSPEDNDCDELAVEINYKMKRELPQLAIGQFKGYTPDKVSHKCNVFVDDKRNVYMILNNKEVVKTDGYDVYRIEF